MVIDQVIQCLNTMYSGASQDSKKQAMDFLENFQKSNESWMITNEYLNNNASNNDNIQIKLFLSQTLRNKLTYDLNQLNDNNLTELRNMILQLILKYSGNNNKLIRIQLNICLSQLILQDLSWLDPLNDLIDFFTENNMFLNLFEFLKILPEELNDINKTFLNDEEFTHRTNSIINENNLTRIFTILDKSINGNELLILDCLNNWIKELPIEKFLSIESLTNLIFNSLNNEALFEKSVECLITIIRETRDIENHQIINAILGKLLDLQTSIKVDEDNFELLARLYLESCESWHVLIAKNPESFYKLVEILLTYLNLDENLNVIHYSFYFWYLLKQLIILPNFKNSRAIFTPIYENLIKIIMKHLTYPISADEDENNNEDHDLFDGDKEQEDKFKEFRYEMADVLKEATVVVGPYRALSIPFENIKSIQLGGSNLKWQNIESSLFTMRSMAKEIPKNENKILPNIMKFLIELPEIPKIRYSATLVLGRYTEWTNMNPEYLEIQLNYIIKGFELTFNANDAKSISMASTSALMYFCQDCSKLMIKYLEQLYILYNQISGKIDFKSNSEVINGISHILLNFNEDDPKMSEFLLVFLKPIFNNLESLYESTDSEKIGENFDLITIIIKILKIRDYNIQNNKVVEIFNNYILPLINKFLTKFIDNLNINEKILKLIKTSVESFNIYLLDNLKNLIDLLLQGFKFNNFGCYLYVSGSILREFSDPEHFELSLINDVFKFGVEQCLNFFKILSTKDTKSLNEIPDVIEDFFRMLDDLLMYYPNQFFDIDETIIINPSIEASVLLFDNFESFEGTISVIHYLIDLVSWGSNNIPVSFVEINNHGLIRSKINNLISSKGDVLLNNLIRNLIFKFNNFNNDTITYELNDLILKFIVLSPHDKVVNWLMKILTDLPNNDNKQLNKFNNIINTAINNKDQKRIRSCLKDYIGWYTRKNIKARTTTI